MNIGDQREGLQFLGGDGLQVIPVQNLREAAQLLEGEIRITPTRVDVAKLFDQPLEDDVDFAMSKARNP